jgi:dihydrolipoamide dehydrogenase
LIGLLLSLPDLPVVLPENTQLIRIRIVRGDRLLAQEEPDVSATLAEAFQQDGISLHFKVTVEQVHYTNGVFTLTLNNGETLEGEALMVVIGRKPNTVALNVAAAGVELDEKGFVKINDQFQTSREGVYAIGDAAGQPAFTHVSWEDYRRLKAILCGEQRTRQDRVGRTHTIRNISIGAFFESFNENILNSKCLLTID